MGTHIDRRSNQRQKHFEGDDLARRRRVSFKQYIRELEEEFEDDLLDEDLSSEEDTVDSK